MRERVAARCRALLCVGSLCALSLSACSDSDAGDDAGPGGSGGASDSPGGASGSSTSAGSAGSGTGASGGAAGKGGSASGGSRNSGGSAGSSAAGTATGGANGGGAGASGGSASGGAGAPNGGGAGSGGSSGAATTDGCGTDPPEPGERALMLDGEERTYVLDLPPDYDPATPYPIVFGFHGASTSGSTFRSEFYGNLLSTLEDAAIVVHPDALGDPTSWDTERDVPFFDALVETLSGELCVDAGRIFATGHSSGGFFTNTLGCERGDVLRAIAPVSGGGPFVFGGTTCAGEVATWIAHGENDETVEFSSGEDSRDHWLEANGCGETSSATTPAGCVEYQGCDAGFPVHFCVYQEGHDWPEFGPEGIADFFLGLGPE
jgi:poly(3-hydroxybutyrate) depolymerase